MTSFKANLFFLFKMLIVCVVAGCAFVPKPFSGKSDSSSKSLNSNENVNWEQNVCSSSKMRTVNGAPSCQEIFVKNNLSPVHVSTMENNILQKMQNEKVSSVAVVVRNENGIVLSKGFGATTQTRFYSASMTKMLTATAVLQLFENGKIELDSPVAKYIPWFSKGSSQNKNITVRHLLTHTAGISREGGVEFWTNPDRWKHPPLEAEMSLAFAKKQVVFQEGTRLKYSNVGYELLGLIVGYVCKNCQGLSASDRYVDYVKKQILIPLEMNRSGFSVQDKNLQEFAIPLGLISAQQNVRQPLPILKGTGTSAPAWGLVSTAEDFSSFIVEVGKAARNSPNKLFTSDVSKLIAVPFTKDPTDSKVGHSHGFMVRETQNGVEVGHTGTFLGYRSAAFTNLKTGQSGVSFINGIDADREFYMYQGLNTVLGTVVTASSKPADFPTMPPLPAPGTPYREIVGLYSGYFATVRVYMKDNKYYLNQGTADYPLTVIEATPTKIIAKFGDVGSYTVLWLGENVEFTLDPQTGKVRSFLAAGSYRFQQLAH